MSEGQDQITILTTLVQSLLQLTGASGPAIVPEGVYTRSQVERNLNLSPNTITVWLNEGLKCSKPATKQYLFFGADLIKFIDEHPNLTHPKDAQEKRERRKRTA